MYKIIPTEKFDSQGLNEFFDQEFVGLHVDQGNLGIHSSNEVMEALKKVGYEGEQMEPMAVADRKLPSKWKSWLIIKTVAFTCVIANFVFSSRLPEWLRSFRNR